MEKKIDDIKETLVEIKADLKYHIKRTDELEKMTTPVYRAYNGAKWAIGAVIGAAAFFTAWAKLP